MSPESLAFVNGLDEDIVSLFTVFLGGSSKLSTDIYLFIYLFYLLRRSSTVQHVHTKTIKVIKYTPKYYKSLKILHFCFRVLPVL